MGLYNRKNKEAMMELRELSEIEREDLRHIIYKRENIDTFQILFGIIAIDLMERSENIEQISYQYLCDKISGDYPHDGLAAKYGIIDTWIRKTMIYQNMGLVHKLDPKTKGLISSIRAATFGFPDAVCHISGGMTGKKQMEMWKFFEILKKELQDGRGLELYQLPVETFQYIVTCLDYLGFNRQEKNENIHMVDVSGITFDEL